MKYEGNIQIPYYKYLSCINFCNDFLRLLEQIEQTNYKLNDNIIIQFCNLVSNTEDKDHFRFYIIEDCDLFYLQFTKIQDSDSYYIGIYNDTESNRYVYHYQYIPTTDIRLLLQIYMNHKKNSEYSTTKSVKLLRDFILNNIDVKYFKEIYHIHKYTIGNYHIFKIIHTKNERIFLLLFDKKRKSISFQYFDRYSNYFKPYFDKNISYYLFNMDDFLNSQW